MVKLLTVSFIFSLIAQISIGILIERPEFDSICNSINRLINQGDDNPIETIKSYPSDGKLQQQLTKQSFQSIQQSGGKLNWLLSLFNTLLQSQDVVIKLEGTNQTKVGVIGKREINNSNQQQLTSSLQSLPCNSIPFPLVIDSNDGQSVNLTLLLINNFLDGYYRKHLQTIN
ncbi:uncharacterized protein LOC128393768 [Panonychus citri]|uniref:uncharacterized protein LOC128393768 n=1 Tax=Panonychus citri TaxID=50023 RepID=UPI002307291B|nr:uncharacterized protein LOC128393768 [Panonychus citri]